jgi:hypothetical protein
MIDKSSRSDKLEQVAMAIYDDVRKDIYTLTPRPDWDRPDWDNLDEYDKSFYRMITERIIDLWENGT